MKSYILFLVTICIGHVALAQYEYTGFDIEPTGNSAPHGYTVSNGKLFFFAGTAAHGTELYVSDGTMGGTSMLKDINPGTVFLTMTAVNYNNKVYFSANDGVNGGELWVSDGTTAGTALLKDVNPGAGSSSIS